MALSFVDSATSTSDTIVIPATAQAGDFAFLSDWGQSGSAPTQVIPTGWTLANGDTANATCRSTLSSKQLVLGDAGSTITGMNGTTFDTKILIVVRSTFGSFSSVTSGGVWGAELLNGNPALQTVLAGVQPAPLLVLGMGGTSSAAAVTFSTASPAFDGSVATALRHAIGYKLYDSAPQNHSVDINDLGSNNCLRTGYFLFTEQAATLMGTMVM